MEKTDLAVQGSNMNDYQRFIAVSRYARWLPDENRRETWCETVERYIDNIVHEHVHHKVGAEIQRSILDLEVMPSMRALMMAGPAADRDNTCIYNCSYLPVDDPRSFDEAMFILLCGTGVGFSVERQYVNKLPEVPELKSVNGVIHVDDSKEGWATAYRTLIQDLFDGYIPTWDVSALRPAGAKLNTFGGRASGPEPLVDLFNFTIDVFKKAQGRKLTSIECHDLMCKIGEIVVVGGVRRSAMISLSNLSDDRMRHAKSGQWWATDPQRALANNSVAFTDKPDAESFMREWLALMESKSGERGVFNRQASVKQAAKNGRRDADWDFGTNPCCVSADTEILTSDGYKRIADTVGDEVEIWNGDEWAAVVPYAAGEADLVRVTLTDGSHLDCTWNHRWVIDGKGFVEARDIKVGDKLQKFDMPVVVSGDDPQIDAYSQGFYSGDGTKGYKRSWVYEPKYPCIDRLTGKVYVDGSQVERKIWNHGAMLDKSFVPVDASLEYRMEWLAGLLDADGTVTRDKNGNGFQIASVDHDFLDRVRLMLTTMGVRAKVVNANTSGYRDMPDGRGGLKEYYCQETKRILIGNMDVYKLMDMGLSLSRLEHNGQSPQRDARRFVRVASIEPLDRFEMTYCFTEPNTSRGTFNGIVTGNSEIILRPYQFCNLTEVVCRADDTLDDLKEKVRLATILGTIQSTYTYFPYLRDVWRENTEAERLLGVSLTGIMDCDLLNQKVYELSDILYDMRQTAIDTNKEWAERLGIPQSAAITCVKPSGTVSQLTDTASGIHARHSDYYIRTVRGDNKDPLTEFMKAQGIPNEPDVMKPDTTTVFSFPVKSPEGAITRNDMTALEQLEFWLTYQRHWCEHKPSVTVSVRDDEWLDVGAWVYKHFDEVSGISFLPHSDHSYQQAPYQDCTREEYEAMLARMPNAIDWIGLAEYEREDTTKGSQTMACVSGVCEIVDLT